MGITEIGVSALSPYSMASDGGAAAAMHEAELDEYHRCLDPHLGYSAACDDVVLLTLRRSARLAATVRTTPYT